MLYQIDITGDSADSVISLFWQNKRRDSEVRNFANQLVEGVSRNMSEIDSAIIEHSEHWDIVRMPVVDRNILRFAIYEILYRNDIPPKVTINEAVELANKFSTTNSGRFINGILDKIMFQSEKQRQASFMDQQE